MKRIQSVCQTCPHFLRTVEGHGRTIACTKTLSLRSLLILATKPTYWKKGHPMPTWQTYPADQVPENCDRYMEMVVWGQKH